ncbi:MAG: nuclear transport factor 2 family protein [Chitinophagales bacterium]
MKNEDFCKQWLAAWSGNRPLELMKFYHPEAYYSDPAKRDGRQGYKQLLPYFEKLLAMNPDWKWYMEELIPTANGFVVKWKATIPTGDKVVHETGLDIVELKDGLIIRNEVYFDRVHWMAAMKKAAAI